MAAVEILTAASFTAEQRRKLAQQGIAMRDGSFPIRNRSDLRNALRALGRASDVERTRDHIIRRARDLGLVDMLPGGWGVTAAVEAAPPDYIENGFRDPFDTVVAAMVEQIDVPTNIGIAPLQPPDEWFEDPQLDAPTPLTVTADGRVYGHLAEFGRCHRGIQGRCVMAPRSPTGYQHFNQGRIMTASGNQVEVGKVTVNAHHAPLTAPPLQAAAHYDHTGVVAAFVRAGEDDHGVWVAGATRSDASPEQIRDLRANPPSGDWRNFGRGLDLVAALAVPVPGFPIVAVAASAAPGTSDLEALIMGWGDSESLAVVAAAGDVASHRDVAASEAGIRTRVLAARISGGVEALADLFR